MDIYGYKFIILSSLVKGASMGFWGTAVHSLRRRMPAVSRR